MQHAVTTRYGSDGCHRIRCPTGLAKNTADADDSTLNRGEESENTLTAMVRTCRGFDVQAWLTVHLPTRRATTLLGRWLAQGVHAGDLILLSGDLGAGKTFTARAMARSMGVPPDVRVTSPTFTVVHEFDTTPRLIHADLYRMGDGSEVDQLLLREARSDGAVLLVEWGEPYLHELGGDALFVGLALTECGRVATLGSTGPRSSSWSHQPLPSKLLARAITDQPIDTQPLDGIAGHMAGRD